MGAAIAFYTLFSLAPLLVLVVAVAGFDWGDEAAQGAMDEQLRGILGEDSAGAVQAMVKNAGNMGTGLVAKAHGPLTMMVAAHTVFGQVQEALYVIGQAQHEPAGAWAPPRTRTAALGRVEEGR